MIEKIEVSFDEFEGTKGVIILKFPQKKNPNTGLIGNYTLWNGHDLSNKYSIVSRKGSVIFGKSINCSNLMNPETYDYIAVTEKGVILDQFTKDYRNYCDLSVKEWKDEVLNRLNNSKQDAKGRKRE